MARIVAMVLLVVASVASPAWGQALKSFSFSSPLIGWVFLDLSGLNSTLQAQGYPSLANNVFIWGAKNTLFFFSGFLQGWHLGFSNWYGNRAARQGDRLARLGLVWSGVFVERPVLSSVSSDPYELFFGLTAGVGLVNFSLLDHSAKDFEDAVRTPSATFLSRWFFTVQPQLSVGVRLIIPLRLTAGYRLTFDNGAWDQEGRALKGPPQNFNGWTVQLMVGP